jgi:hypothetical protein
MKKKEDIQSLINSLIQECETEEHFQELSSLIDK